MTLQQSLNIIALPPYEMCKKVESLTKDEQREHHQNLAAISLVSRLNNEQDFIEQVKFAKSIFKQLRESFYIGD